MGFDHKSQRPHWSNTSWWALLVLFFSEAGAFNRFYSKVTTRVEVGADINIFGLMRYDVAQGAYFMDKPVAMSPADSIGTIGTLKWQQIWLQVRNVFGLMGGVSLFLVGLAAFGYSFYAFSRPAKSERNDDDLRD